MVTVKSKLWHTIKTQVVVVSQEKRKKKDSSSSIPCQTKIEFSILVH